jgi:hypothetical protein
MTARPCAKARPDRIGGRGIPQLPGRQGRHAPHGDDGMNAIVATAAAE